MASELKFIEERRLSALTLKHLCIEHGWYTLGSNNDYENLLYHLVEGRNITTDALTEIAEDIIGHSSEERMGQYRIEDVMFTVALVCKPLFLCK